jgi:hypothetical protein
MKLPKQQPPVAQSQPEIVCPVMRGMVAEGHLQVDGEGDAQISELKDIFQDLGFKRNLAYAAAVGNGFWDIGGNLMSGTFNVNELRGGLLDHSGDSLILRDGQFDPERFDKLVSHSADGQRMTEADFMKAVQTNKKDDDASWIGSKISEVEFGLLLKAFGTEGADGVRGVSIDDLRGLYQDKKSPPSFRPETASAAKVGVAGLASQVRGLPTESRVGMAQAGADSALEGGNLLDSGGVAAKGAGQAACPYVGAGAEAVSENPAEITQTHNELPGAIDIAAQ